MLSVQAVGVVKGIWSRNDSAAKERITCSKFGPDDGILAEKKQTIVTVLSKSVVSDALFRA